MEKLNIERPLFAIDGKTNRRSHDHANDLGALHSVSVWASELGLSLAQVACAEKSNEITAIPEVLQLVDITGAIITIDAMGTQKAIAQQIIAGKGDYVLALKGNQEKLHKFVMEYVCTQLENDFANIDARQHTVTETLHGQEEKRIYVQLPVPQDMPMLAEWAGLKTIGMAVRVYHKDGREVSDVRYYICSLAMGVKEFARAVRGHWGSENSCHWTLDMTFREDESRIRGKGVVRTVYDPCCGSAGLLIKCRLGRRRRTVGAGSPIRPGERARHLGDGQHEHDHPRHGRRHSDR